MTVDFNDYFWGEKNNGFDVLYHNMKFGLVASKELAEFFREKSNVEEQNSKMMLKLAHKASTGTLNSTFAPVWTILRTSAEKLSTLHLQMVQKLTELVKDVAKYADELHRKHKTVKEEESQTLECVQAMQASTAAVQKARDLYNTKMQELEKLRKDNASQKDVDKVESKLRKLQEEYKALLDKHNPIKTEFERRMTQTCKRFQEIEEVHLRQMKEFLSTFLEMLQNNHDMVGQVHSDFKRQFNDMTVDKLLEQFVLNKYTGLERPEVPELEFIPLSKQQQQSISATRLNQPVAGTSNSNSASGSVCLDQRGNNEAGSVASGLVSGIGGAGGGSDSLYNADDAILGITTSPRPNSPELVCNLPPPATTSAPPLAAASATTTSTTSVKSNFRNWFSSSIPSKSTTNTPIETNAAQAAVTNTSGNFGMDSHGTPHTGTTATIMINSLKSELQSLQDNNNQGSFMSSALTKLPEQTANNSITTTNTTNFISNSTTTSTTTTSSATSVTMTQSQSHVLKILLSALSKSLRERSNESVSNSITGNICVEQRGSNEVTSDESHISRGGSDSLVKEKIRNWLSSNMLAKSTVNKPIEKDDLGTSCTASTATFMISSSTSNLLPVTDNNIQGSLMSSALTKLAEEIANGSSTTINTTSSTVCVTNTSSATTVQSQCNSVKDLMNAMTKDMVEQSNIGPVSISNSISSSEAGENPNAKNTICAPNTTPPTGLPQLINMPAPALKPAPVTPSTAGYKIDLLLSNICSEASSHPPNETPLIPAARTTASGNFLDTSLTDTTTEVLDFLKSTLQLLQSNDIQDSLMPPASTKLPELTEKNSKPKSTPINLSKSKNSTISMKNQGQQTHDQQQRCTSPTSVTATTATTTNNSTTTTAARKFTEQFSTSLSERSNHHPHQHSHSTTHHTSASTTSTSNAANSRRTTSLLNIFTSNSQVSGILRSRRDKTKTKKLKKKKDGDSAENIQEERMTSVERGNDSYNYDDHNKTMAQNSSGITAGGLDAARRRVGGLSSAPSSADPPGGSGVGVGAGVGAPGANAFVAAGAGSVAGVSAATGVANAAAAGAGNGTVSVGVAAGSGAAYGANEVDEDGYSMQPPKEIAWEENTENVASFYSDSDSDSETEKPERRIHVKIKPLNNGQAPMSASVDELRATVENISLSPTGHSQQLQQSRIPSRQQSPEISNASTPTASVHPYAPLQSPTLSMSNNSRYADLGDIFSELGDMSASAPASATLARHPTRQIPTPTSTNNIAIPRPPSRRSEMAGGGASSVGAAAPQSAAALAAARGRISPLPMNRADSIGSLEFRTAIAGIGSSRGPSPLTIGISDTIPLAVAFHEIIHAYFRGSDESRCQVKISGDMMLSFPAGIAGLLANNPNPAKLGFRIKNTQNLENLIPNSKLVQIDRNQSSAFSTMLEFNMTALTALLRRQTENNPTASYFNVDILKYQVRCKPGASSCPFQLVCYWKCEPTFTALKIDYKYNNHAMVNASPLLNVTLAVPVSGSVRNVQSKPHSAWLGESNRLVWNFTDISQNSQDGGVGTLRARLELNDGPSIPAILSTQFNCEGTTLSGIEFELQGSGYRLSLVKRRFVSGKYVCEGDGIRSGATPTPPSVGSSSPFSAKSN